MGAWDCKVMTNDDALDLIEKFVFSNNLERDIKEILESGGENTYTLNELLLAAEIVDISINGIDKDILGESYEYEEWFSSLTNAPLYQLKVNALNTVAYIHDTEKSHDVWIEEYRLPREQLLIKVRERLAIGYQEKITMKVIKTKENTNMNSTGTEKTTTDLQEFTKKIAEERGMNVNVINASEIKESTSIPLMETFLKFRDTNHQPSRMEWNRVITELKEKKSSSNERQN